VEFALGLNVDWVIQWNRWPRQLATLPEKADVFSRAWQNAIKSRYGDLRLEIQPSGHRRLGVDLRWLVNQLSRPAVAANSVYVRQDEPSQPVSWNWPIRIVVLTDRRSKVLQKEISASSYKHLFEVKTLER